VLSVGQMARPVSPRLPGAGPILLTVPGVSDVTIPANTVGAEIFFRWPGPYVWSGIWLGDELVATPAAVAKLRLRMVDDSRNELMIDGRGGLDTAGALSLCGRVPRWQPFRRVMRSGQKWLFQVENRNAFDVRPLLYLRLEEE